MRWDELLSLLVGAALVVAWLFEALTKRSRP